MLSRLPGRRPVLLTALLAAGLALPTAAQNASPLRITLQASPAKLVGAEPAQLLVTIEPQGALQNAVLKIAPPPGFQVDRNNLAMASLSGKLTQLFTVRRKEGQEPKGGGLLLVSLEVPQAGRKEPQQVAAESLKLDYAPEISVRAYILLGILGVGLGYGLRLLLKVLQSIPPEAVPAPAPIPPGQLPPLQPGPITSDLEQLD